MTKRTPDSVTTQKMAFGRSTVHKEEPQRHKPDDPDGSERHGRQNDWNIFKIYKKPLCVMRNMIIFTYICSLGQNSLQKELRRLNTDKTRPMSKIKICQILCPSYKD